MRNGAFSYSVIAFAERAEVVFFLSLETLQFGFGHATDDGLGDGRQFPSARLAALTFLQTKGKAAAAVPAAAGDLALEGQRLKG